MIKLESLILLILVIELFLTIILIIWVVEKADVKTLVEVVLVDVVVMELTIVEEVEGVVVVKVANVVIELLTWVLVSNRRDSVLISDLNTTPDIPNYI